MASGGIPHFVVLSSVIHPTNPFTTITSPLSFIKRMVFCFVLSMIFGGMPFSLCPVFCQWWNGSIQDLFSHWHSDMTDPSVFSSVAVSPHCVTHCQSELILSSSVISSSSIIIWMDLFKIRAVNGIRRHESFLRPIHCHWFNRSF